MAAAGRKRFPPRLSISNDRLPRSDSPVMGGSLTRSPSGRLQTLQTHGIYPSPQGVQEVWANASRQRYPQAWDGQQLAQAGHWIEWDEPRRIVCSHCGRSLGDYVAYRIRYPDGRLQGEHGIVEKISRRYERHAEIARRQAASRGPKSRPRFQLEGEIGRRAAKTTAVLHCPGCRREYRRNLARLGRQLFEHPKDAAFLLE